MKYKKIKLNTGFIISLDDIIMFNDGIAVCDSNCGVINYEFYAHNEYEIIEREVDTENTTYEQFLIEEKRKSILVDRALEEAEATFTKTLKSEFNITKLINDLRFNNLVCSTLDAYDYLSKLNQEKVNNSLLEQIGYSTQEYLNWVQDTKEFNKERNNHFDRIFSKYGLTYNY